MARRYVGEHVRYYRVGTGWLFGVVTAVTPANRRTGAREFADVYFPAVRARCKEQTLVLASDLLERLEFQPNCLDD